jgi:hypothetical protein
MLAATLTLKIISTLLYVDMKFRVTRRQKFPLMVIEGEYWDIKMHSLYRPELA